MPFKLLYIDMIVLNRQGPTRNASKLAFIAAKETEGKLREIYVGYRKAFSSESFSFDFVHDDLGAYSSGWIESRLGRKPYWLSRRDFSMLGLMRESIIWFISFTILFTTHMGLQFRSLLNLPFLEWVSVA